MLGKHAHVVIQHTIPCMHANACHSPQTHPNKPTAMQPQASRHVMDKYCHEMGAPDEWVVGLMLCNSNKWDKLPNWSRHIMIEEHRHGIYSRPCPKCGERGLDGWHATIWTENEQKKRKTEWKTMCDVGLHCHDKLFMRKVQRGAKLPVLYQ